MPCRVLALTTKASMRTRNRETRSSELRLPHSSNKDAASSRLRAPGPNGSAACSCCHGLHVQHHMSAGCCFNSSSDFGDSTIACAKAPVHNMPTCSKPQEYSIDVQFTEP